MKILVRKIIVATVCLLIIVRFAAAQSREQISVPLSQPGKPFDLQLQLPRGTIDISSYSGTTIEIEAEPETPKPGPHGNRNQNQNQTSVTHNRNEHPAVIAAPPMVEGKYIRITESVNTVTIKPVNQSQQLSIKIRVPKEKSIFRVNSSLRADITIREVSGEMDITNNGGQILLTNILGSAVVSNVAGGITATFKTVSPTTPMAFSTLAGVIDVSIPASTKANVKAHSDNSPFVSDFETDYTSNHEPKVTRTTQGRYQITNANNLSGRIGGGGAELRFKTMEGPIYLRKTK